MNHSVHASRQGSFNSLEKQFRKLADQVFGQGYHGYSSGEAWTPAVNLYEDDVSYHIVVDISGVDPENIELESSGEDITIRGHRPTPQPPQSQGCLRLEHMEIDHGRFCRTLKLPQNVDVEDITAVYRSGQLLISLPKNR